MRSCRRLPPILSATVPLLLAGACESGDRPTGEAETWTTEAEFEIGDALEGDAVFGVVDTLAVWYAIGRGDTGLSLRRVLLPTGFAMHDGTANHVWGVHEDS